MENTKHVCGEEYDKMTPEEAIDKLRQLLSDTHDYASPAPWKEHYAANGGGIPISAFHIPGHNQGKTVEMRSPDAEFICAARIAIPFLLQHYSAAKESK